MKKQILVLVVFMLAVFGSINNANAQKLTAAPATAALPTPIAIGCNVADNGLLPIPGNAYDYDVSVSIPATGGVFTYDWFVTTDPAFITASGLQTTMDVLASSTHVAAVGTGTGYSPYHNTTGSTNKIKITWQSFVPSASVPVFLVIYVKNTAACTTGNDNIQVYEIKPQASFTLDLANIAADGTAAVAGYTTCVSSIVGAAWNATDKKVIMTYGENYLYFAVTAANFTHSWLPSFQVSATESGTGTTSTMDVSWAYATESYGTTPVWHATTATGSIYKSTDAVAAPSNGSVGKTGQSIIVRVHINHVNDQSLADNTISFAVDGIMKDPAATVATNYYTNTAMGDLDATSTNAECGKIDDFKYDKTTQVILARPTITAGSPSPFVGKTN